MNILQVCAYAAPYPGNFLKSLQALDEKLALEGHKTYYAFPETAKEYEWCRELKKKTKVFFLPLSKARIKPYTYRYIKEILRLNKIDIVHSHFELYDIPIAITLPKQTKMVWHLHDAIQNDYNNTSILRKIVFKLHYNFFSKNAYLISVSEKHKNFAVKLGFKEDNTIVILNGTDLERINKVKSDGNKKFDFLMFGWDFKRKGVDLVIKAGKKLYEDGYRFKISVVGSEDTWNNQEFNIVKDAKWLHKQNFVEDINELYSKSKIFLHPSRAEGCSYALQEAIYSGLSVISSNIPENIFARDIPTVTMFENENEQQLYNKMKNYLDKKISITEKDIFKSQQVIEEDYSIKVWAKKIRDEYMKLVG